jgi:membrane-bound serine protease (ClpP class)
LEIMKISCSVIVPAVGLTAVFFAFAIGMGIRAQRRKPTTGVEGIVGEIGVTLTPLNPNGQVRVHGEIWNATSDEGKIPSGTRIIVRAVNNLQLQVKRTSPPTQ